MIVGSWSKGGDASLAAESGFGISTERSVSLSASSLGMSVALRLQTINSARRSMLQKPLARAEDRDHRGREAQLTRCRWGQVETFGRRMKTLKAIFERSKSAGASIVCQDAALTAIVIGVAMAMIPSGDMPLRK